MNKARSCVVLRRCGHCCVEEPSQDWALAHTKVANRTASREDPSPAQTPSQDDTKSVSF